MDFSDFCLYAALCVVKFILVYGFAMSILNRICECVEHCADAKAFGAAVIKDKINKIEASGGTVIEKDC